MNILGERFYNMDNHEPIVFTIPQVTMVMVQPVEIVAVDEVEMVEVGKTTVYCVVVVLESGMFCSTQPLDNEQLATEIATKLADFCKRHQDSN